ncbi:hypothetical protein Avbf_04068 [Armadillidium vulgare]|nr:hypothetical protein Avbf_04068 [Armadillidium vulgare]
MRRPQVSSEKQDYKNSCHAQSSSGAFARVRRFLAVSIGGQDTSRTIATIKRPCDSLSPPTSQSFSNLRAEAETVLGRC